MEIVSISFDESLVVRTSKAVSPSDLFLARATSLLLPGEGSPGFFVIDGLQDFFLKNGFSVFEDLDQSVVPDSTTFLNSLIAGVMKAQYGQGEIDTKHLTFSGIGSIGTKGQAASKGDPSSWGNRKKYLRATRMGVEQMVSELLKIASECGESVSREMFFSDAIIDTNYGSTKRPHFDSIVGIAALQKFVRNVSGGASQVYDVGEFCAVRRLNIWDVLAPHSPPTESAFGTEAQTFTPFNALAVKDKFVSDVISNFSSTLDENSQSVLVFNNQISYCQSSGRFFGVAHGATKPEALNSEAVRNLCLSISHSQPSSEETKRMLRILRAG